MNSYTVPLAEGYRHAVYQAHSSGSFIDLPAASMAFVDIGLTNRADGIPSYWRSMGILYGITTTNKKVLDKRPSRTRPRPAEDAESTLAFIVEQIQSWEDIHHGNLMRPYVAYSLFLALTHVTSPVAALEPVFDVQTSYRWMRHVVLTNLTTLSDALENPDERRIRPLCRGMQKHDERPVSTRNTFRWMCDAPRIRYHANSKEFE